MRDLNLDELEMVYGAGSKGRGCGDSPTPPSCWCDGGSKGSKGSKGSNHSKNSNRPKKKSKHSKC